MRNKQDVILILDELSAQGEASLWKYVRKAVHSLRAYAYSRQLELSVAFANLSQPERPDMQERLSFYAFDTFSIEKERQGSYFSEAAFPALNYYFSMRAPGKEKEPLLIILHKNPPEQGENYRRLNSLVGFRSAKKVLVPQPDWESSEPKLSSFSFPGKGARGLGAWVSRAAESKSVRPVLAGVGGTALLAVLLMVLVPRIAQAVRNGRNPAVSAVYKKVYTGDGDRLILRAEGDLNAQELLRLNEGEVVMLIEEGSVWDNVSYHGFDGFVHNEYLVPAAAGEYGIQNPDTMYTYGKALLQNGIADEDNHDGYYWIEQSASLGEVSAQWEMFRFYENGALPAISRDASRAESYLLGIHMNPKSYEEQEAEYCRQVAKNLETTAQKDLVAKYLSKAQEKERNARAIRRQAEKTLSELYFSVNASVASSYYKVAMQYGLEGDPDYMYALAVETNLDEADSIEWLRKASGMGHYDSSRVLAEYYFNRENYDSALTYFRAAANQSSLTSSSWYYCGWIYYHQQSNYSRAVDCFENAYECYDYSAEFYQAAYYLGWCYEYGQGVSRNDYYALSYYNVARGHVSQAEDAYNRVYKKVYGDYYYGW